MNLQELWSGSDYAWFEWKGNGETFRRNAPRVKVIRTFKRKESGNKRESGYAEVMLCDQEGIPKTHSDGTHITREVRARDIACRWEEYEAERDYRRVKEEKEEKERKERYEKMRVEREERERIFREEREERERVEREEWEKRRAEEVRKVIAIREGLENKGISNGIVHSIDPSYVILNRAALEKELGIASNQ